MSTDRRSRRDEAAAVRRLNAALGLTPHRDVVLGGVIGIAILSALMAAAWLANGVNGPVEKTTGVVTGLGFRETDHGSRPYASVRVDGRAARVRLRTGGLCLIGDRIDLQRRKALLGYRYRLGAGGCSRPAAH